MVRGITKTNYFVTRKSNSTEMKSQIVHKNDRAEYFNKKRDDRNISVKKEMADLMPMFIQPLVIYTLLRDIIVEIKAYPSLRNLLVQVK